MSLPSEILDQLLSGYLDGVLSDDERTRVEEVLRSDPAAAHEYEQLLEVREAVRQLGRSRSASLGAGFANRVVESAIAQAEAEGLGDDHPLVRLAEQPATSGERHQAAGRRRWVAVIVGLAASLVLGMILMRPGRNGPDDAAIDSIAGGPSNAPNLIDQLENGPQQNATDDTNDRSATMLAEDDSARSPTAELIPDRENADASEVAIESVAELSPTAFAVEPDKLADDTNRSPPGSTYLPDPFENVEPSAASDQKTIANVAGILIIEVKQSLSGRANRAVEKAMRRSGIDATHQRPVSGDIVSSVNDAAPLDNERPAQIVYLHGPIKQLDRFILALHQDRQGIESVGWNAAFDAPVLEPLNDAEIPQPTEIRDDAAWAYFGSDNQVLNQLAEQLSDRDYLPYPHEDDAAAGKGGLLGVLPSDGPDMIGQLVVLVR